MMASEFNVGAVNFKKKKELFRTIFNNMVSHHGGEVKAGILLKGDTGVGKTSFVRDMCKLLGMPLVLIETPHITEEHIINIPFIVADPVANHDVKMSLKVDQRKYRVELADSNLFTQISKQKIVKDSEYLANLYNESKTSEDILKVYESLGGTKDKVPTIIKTLRNWYRCVLFLDEFFRQTSPTIRNMLRTILNGRLGELHVLPQDLYVIYASNIVDEGVGDIAEQEQFEGIYFGTEGENNGQTVDYEIGTDEWFAYLVSRFKKDHRVSLNKKVVDKFYELFTENAEQVHLSINDVESDVRTSPRRWEQLILYVNSSLPVKDEAEAKALLSNVRTSFVNYDHGDREAKYSESSILDLVIKTVSELIHETSGISLKDGNKYNKPSDWRSTLEHQVKQAIKMGHHRKYIPVIAGTPGIAKTTHVNKLAIDLLMVPVIFDVSHISAESIIGLPVPHEGNDKGIETEFSVPVLYQAMQKQMRDGEKHLFDALKKHLTGDEAAAKIKEYKDKEYKYLLFFDELNRAHSSKVFNAIRRVLLERSFGEDSHGKDLKIPEGSVIVAAINPTGQNTIPFTRHIKDVIDIIPAGASWKDFSGVLDKITYAKDADGHAPDDDVIKLSRNVLNAFVDRFKTRVSPSSENDKEFYIDLDPDGDTPIYIAPRAYQQILVSSTRAFNDIYTETIDKLNGLEQADKNEVLKEADKDIRDALYKAYRRTLTLEIEDKQNKRSAPALFQNLREWFLHSDEFDVLDVLKVSVKTSDLESILDKIYGRTDTQLFDDIDFISYLNNVDEQTYAADLSTYLEKKYDHIKVMTDRKLPMKTLVGRDVKIEDKNVTWFEYLMREILHTIKIHKLAGHMLDVTRQAFMKFAEIFIKEDHVPKGIQATQMTSIEKVVDHVKTIVPKKYYGSIYIGTTPLSQAKTKDGTWVEGDVIVKNSSEHPIEDLDEYIDNHGLGDDIMLAKMSSTGYKVFDTFIDAIRDAMFYKTIGRLKVKIKKLVKEFE